MMKVSVRRLLLSLCGVVTLVSSLGWAQVQDEAKGSTYSLFLPHREPERPRSYILMPLASAFVPGLDQWIEGQHSYAAFYGSYSLVGWRLMQAKGNTKDFEDFNQDRFLGLAMMKAGAGLSLYHTFRTAAATQRSQGKFTFLTAEDTPQDLALAPFQYKYLANATTWGYLLGVGAVFVALNQGGEDLPKNSRRVIRGQDALYSLGGSYNTAIGEEALFRGYLLPVLQQETGSPLAANLIQAGTFTLLHTGGAQIFSLPLGLIGGYTTQKSGGSIGEAIFIHTWGNTMGALFQYYRYRLKGDKQAVIPITFQFPTIYL